MKNLKIFLISLFLGYMMSCDFSSKNMDKLDKHNLVYQYDSLILSTIIQDSLQCFTYDSLITPISLTLNNFNFDTEYNFIYSLQNYSSNYRYPLN